MYKNYFSYLFEDKGLKFDELKEKRFKNPETGKLIKIASALTYDEDREPYKMAIEYLKLYGLEYNKDDKDTDQKKSSTGKSTKETKPTEKLIDVNKLYFRFNSKDNELTITNTSDKDAPYIKFDSNDGITSIKLLDDKSESNLSSFKKPKYYKIGDRFDLNIAKKTNTYESIRKYLTDNKRAFAKKITNFKNEMDGNDDKRALSLLSDLKDAFVSNKK